MVLLIISDPRVGNQDETLIWACEKGFLRIVAFFLNDPRLNWDTDIAIIVLECAAEKGHLDIIKCLMADQRISGFTKSDSAILSRAIRCASEFRQWHVVSYWISNPIVDLSYDGCLVLEHAAMDNKVDFMDIILKDSKVDPSIDDNRIIILTSYQCGNAVDAVNRLLQDERVRARGNFNHHILKVIKDNNDHLGALAFCCKEIGNGWADLMYTITTRTGLPFVIERYNNII